jgi:hypothetical protein
MNTPITWNGWIYTFTHRNPVTKEITRKVTKKNLITTYGLGQLSSAIGGGYTPPQYLAIESAAPTLLNSPVIGATSFTSTDLALPNTGVMCVGLGAASQENVTCTAISTVSGTTTYTISPGFVNNHTAGEVFTLIPTAADDPTVIQTALQYDPINNPNQWINSVAGYQSGTGQYTLSFYLTAIQAVGYFTKVGLTDSVTIGTGNLHSWLLYGVDHSAQIEDIQVDCVLTSTSV